MLLKKALEEVRGFQSGYEDGLLWCSIPEIVHNHVKSDDLVWLWKQLLLIIRNQGEVIKVRKFFNINGCWIGI